MTTLVNICDRSDLSDGNSKVNNPERSLSDEKSSQGAQKSFSFSDFPQTIDTKKNILAVLMLTISKNAKSRAEAYAFFTIKASVLAAKKEDFEPYEQFDSARQFDENELQASNPEHGFLALQSKFSFREHVRAHSRNAGKQMNKKVFLMARENQMLKNHLKKLEEEVKKMDERKNKEIAKKQGSLVGLMQELSEKNEEIEELKSTIRTLGSKIKSKEKGVHYMLEEDSQSFRRTILRLEHVNDKLNLDVSRFKTDIEELRNQIKEYKSINGELQFENQKLKEINFDLETNQSEVDMMRREAQLVGKRFNGKIDKVRKLQKRLSMVVKTKDFFGDEQSETKPQNGSSLKKVSSVAESTISTMLKKTETIAEQTTAHKLQDVFNYLFNIADDDYDLQEEDLFEEEEREFLRNHKELFNKHRIMHSIEKHSNDNYSAFFGQELEDLLNQKELLPEKKQKDKLRSLQKECEAMISKVYMLKQRQLHIRSVVLNLLKVLDLRSIKRQTENILSILCQLFEYSECERQIIFAAKSRKLFGIL